MRAEVFEHEGKLNVPVTIAWGELDRLVRRPSRTRMPPGARLVQLPGWLYPVVCDTATGSLRFDNYNGSWGRQEHLGRFLQAYAIERAGIEARKRGHQVFEQALADGSIKLTIQVGGAS